MWSRLCLPQWISLSLTKPCRNNSTPPQDLSIKALKYLLQSDKLQCLSENELHLLIGVNWHFHENYDQLVEHLRFEHMDAHYVGNMLANCPRLIEWELLPTVMSMALSRRGIDHAILEAQGVLLTVNRGLSPGEAEWALKVSLPLAQCTNVSEANPLFKCLGAAAGYPVGMRVEQAQGKGKGKAQTFGLKFRLKMNGQTTYRPDDPPPIVKRGVLMRVQARVGGEGEWKTMTCFLGDQEWQWWDDMLGVAWGFAVREGSPFFPQGEMKVETRFKVVVD